jgi:hypothetical protein
MNLIVPEYLRSCRVDLSGIAPKENTDTVQALLNLLRPAFKYEAAVRFGILWEDCGNIAANIGAFGGSKETVEVAMNAILGWAIGSYEEAAATYQTVALNDLPPSRARDLLVHAETLQRQIIGSTNERPIFNGCLFRDALTNFPEVLSQDAALVLEATTLLRDTAARRARALGKLYQLGG